MHAIHVFTVASLIQLGGPVENDGHGLRLCLCDSRENQESLTVAAHVIANRSRLDTGCRCVA